MMKKFAEDLRTVRRAPVKTKASLALALTSMIIAVFALGANASAHGGVIYTTVLCVAMIALTGYGFVRAAAENVREVHHD